MRNTTWCFFLWLIKKPGKLQRVDVEIIDSSPKKNVYLSKRGIDGETRLAVTAHSEGDVGVCFKNHLDSGEFWFYFMNYEIADVSL